jgi:hypothetical protein
VSTATATGVEQRCPHGVAVLTLDRSRPFAVVSPAWSGDKGEFDRPAPYEQEGRLFGSYGVEIVPGRPLVAHRGFPWASIWAVPGHCPQWIKVLTPSGARETESGMSLAATVAPKTRLSGQWSSLAATVRLSGIY